MQDKSPINSRVLIVDDDSRLRELLIGFLEAYEMDVSGVTDATEMLNHQQLGTFDLYILDINLPGMNGWDLCRLLRDQGDNTPIIMLTARSEDHDRIQGLELGADDYLPKPFNSHELLARIRAVLRRFNFQRAPSIPSQTEIFVFDDFKLDPVRNQLTLRGQIVWMTSTELLLLKLLHEYRGRIASRSLICQKIHKRDHLPDDRSVDVLISNIRKILGSRPDGTPYIQTIRNRGYMLALPSSPAEVE